MGVVAGKGTLVIVPGKDPKTIFTPTPYDRGRMLNTLLSYPQNHLESNAHSMGLVGGRGHRAPHVSHD